MTFNRWHKFALGLAMLAVAVLFFSSGYSPPGPAGEVLRHNQAHDIDATPFFYGDVERMSEYEAGVAAMRESASANSTRDTAAPADTVTMDSTVSSSRTIGLSTALCDPIEDDCN